MYTFRWLFDHQDHIQRHGTLEEQGLLAAALRMRAKLPTQVAYFIANGVGISAVSIAGIDYDFACYLDTLDGQGAALLLELKREDS